MEKGPKKKKKFTWHGTDVGNHANDKVNLVIVARLTIQPFSFNFYFPGIHFHLT